METAYTCDEYNVINIFSSFDTLTHTHKPAHPSFDTYRTRATEIDIWNHMTVYSLNYRENGLILIYA